MPRLTLFAALALAACACPPAARADVPPEARAILDRYIQATGGRAAFDADSVLHVRGRLHVAGLDGTFELWSVAPDRVLSVDRVGRERTRSGFDGAAGWRTDLTSRQVGPLEGRDLEALRAEVWFQTEQWARDTSAKIVLGERALFKHHALVALDVTPPVGPGKLLWFDEASGLLLRITHHRAQYTWSEELSGWKTLAGRRRATVWTSGDSLFASSFERTVVESVDGRRPEGPAPFSRPASTAPAVTWLHAHGVARIPFRYAEGHVWVQVSLDGAAPANFILDTGASGTAVDRGYAQTLGLRTEGDATAEGVAGEGDLGFAGVGALRLLSPDGGDGIETRDLRVGVLELQDGLSSLDWDRADGLLGYDVLSRFVVELDFDHHLLTLYDPSTFRYAGGGAGLPMTLQGNVPTVDLTLNGTCTGRFMVDVGNATVLSVNSAQVDRCHLFGPNRKDVEYWVGGIGGALPESVCRLDSLQLGPYGWAGPVAGLTTHHLGMAGDTDTQGNIGTTVLDRFRCTFDYARDTLWLEPGARYREPDAFTRSGLWVTRYEGAVMVVGVVRRSPAEEAGFKVRDVLVAVNGVPIERWTPQELDRVLTHGAAGSVVKIVRERDLDEQEIELTLTDVL